MAVHSRRRDKIYKIKKLALAYKTGWEYTPEGEEAGSVLMDVFLDMLEENEGRLAGKWEKHHGEFVRVAPDMEKSSPPARLGFLVRASREAAGKMLAAGTKLNLVSPEGRLVRFGLCNGVRLTEARLKYVVYQRGLSAWLTYRSGGDDKGEGISLFDSAGECLWHPCFLRRYRGLCDGMRRVRFRVEFSKDHQGAIDSIPREGFRISDGKTSYPLALQGKEELALCGDTPGYAGNLGNGCYEIRLDIPEGEEPDAACLDILSGKMSLKLEAENCPAEFCITDDEIGASSEVRPFGREPDISACCYIACDGAMTPRNRNIALSFVQECEVEERLPVREEGDKRLYKKYPWLRDDARAEDWRAEDFLWEYYNGSCWRGLSGNRQGAEKSKAPEGEQELFLPENNGKSCTLRFCRPEDMEPCVIEGRERYFIRVRPGRVNGAYAAYYRKYIPVMKNIMFFTEELRFDSIAEELPKKEDIGTEKLYFGFDHDVTAENTWYAEYREGDRTKRTVFSFREDMLAGKRTVYGLSAFWAAADKKALNGKAVITKLEPNYAEGVQIPEEKKGRGTGDVLLPQNSRGFIKTREYGQLDVLSLWDGELKGSGEQGGKVPDKKGFFQGFGRIATYQDLKELIRSLYPELEVLSCELSKETGSLDIVIKRCGGPEGEETERKTEDIQKRLKELIQVYGGLWIKDCPVRLRSGGPEGRAEADGES